MSMMRIIGILVAVAAVAVLAFSVWMTTTYNYSRDIANQERIAKAYIRYFAEQKEFPLSLDSLISKGYLPERGSFYLEPPTLFGGEVSYSQGCYAVFAPENGKVESLRMIGRKTTHDGKEHWDYLPMINAMVRDEIDSVTR